MQVTEITIGGERKRPMEQYGSASASAFVKISVFPGDDVAAAVAEGQRIVAAAIGEDPAQVFHAHATEAPSAGPALGADAVRVLVAGRTFAVKEELRAVGLEWSKERNAWTGSVNLADVARLQALPDVTVQVLGKHTGA